MKNVKKLLLEPQTVNSTRKVIRSYTPACAKPLVELNLPVAAFHQYLSILQN